MTTYYPYVLIETNVEPEYLLYDFYIYDTAKDKVVGRIKYPSVLVRSNKLKKISENLFQTQYINVDGSKLGVETIRDCVIIFNLYRLSSSGKDYLVIEDYIVPEKIESYIKPDFNKSIYRVKFNEARYVTKVVSKDVSKNTLTLSLSSNQIFQCLDAGYNPGEPNNPFSKTKIEAGLKARLNEPLPDQYMTSLCGPAVYFFCLINLSSPKYKLLVQQLWNTGQAKIGTLSIQPSNNGCRKVKNFYRKDNTPKIPPIDWMTLASLRESENVKLKLNDPDQEVAGITTWNEVSGWFEKSGFNVVKKWSFSIGGYDWSLINEINKYAGSDCYVITLISASILRDGASSGTSLFPDHWIVWTDKLRDNKGQPITHKSEPWSNVQLKLFSWGENKEQLKSEIKIMGYDVC